MITDSGSSGCTTVACSQWLLTVSFMWHDCRHSHNWHHGSATGGIVTTVTTTYFISVPTLSQTVLALFRFITGVVSVVTVVTAVIVGSRSSDRSARAILAFDAHPLCCSLFVLFSARPEFSGIKESVLISSEIFTTVVVEWVFSVFYFMMKNRCHHWSRWHCCYNRQHCHHSQFPLCRDY